MASVGRTSHFDVRHGADRTILRHDGAVLRLLPDALNRRSIARQCHRRDARRRLSRPPRASRAAWPSTRSRATGATWRCSARFAAGLERAAERPRSRRSRGVRSASRWRRGYAPRRSRARRRRPRLLPFLVLDRRIDAQSGRRSARAAGLAGAAALTCRLEEVDRLLAAPGHVDAARAPRSRADRGALRHRPARLGAGPAASWPTSRSTRAS